MSDELLLLAADAARRLGPVVRAAERDTGNRGFQRRNQATAPIAGHARVTSAKPAAGTSRYPGKIVISNDNAAFTDYGDCWVVDVNGYPLTVRRYKIHFIGVASDGLPVVSVDTEDGCCPGPLTSALGANGCCDGLSGIGSCGQCWGPPCIAVDIQDGLGVVKTFYFTSATATQFSGGYTINGQSSLPGLCSYTGPWSTGSDSGTFSYGASGHVGGATGGASGVGFFENGIDFNGDVVPGGCGAGLHISGQSGQFGGYDASLTWNGQGDAPLPGGVSTGNAPRVLRIRGTDYANCAAAGSGGGLGTGAGGTGGGTGGGGGVYCQPCDPATDSPCYNCQNGQFCANYEACFSGGGGILGPQKSPGGCSGCGGGAVVASTSPAAAVPGGGCACHGESAILGLEEALMTPLGGDKPVDDYLMSQVDSSSSVSSFNTRTGAVTLTAADVTAVGSTLKYSTTITGDGATTSFNVDHNLGTKNVTVAVFNSTDVLQETPSSGAGGISSVTTSTANRVVVVFSVAPGAGATYRVVVVG